MSTNKTPNYQLHSWLGTDDFRFHEVNENFTALDQHLGRVDSYATQMAYGTYIGPGSSHTLQVDLGFRPKVVFAMVSTGVVYNTSDSQFFIALSVDGMENSTLLINDTGFLARSIDKCRMTYKDYQFNYIALR